MATNNLSFWLKRAFLAVRKAYDEAVAPYSLTSAQLEVLGYLWIEDGQEMRVLQEKLSISSPAITGLVDALVESGLVERRLSAEDARVRQVFLTHSGRSLATQLSLVAEQFESKISEEFSPTEAAMLTEWLRRLALHFDK